LISQIPAFHHEKGMVLTESFSTIPTAPATDADSKVNIELSRWNVSGSHIHETL
jgi:hypothetical protein